MKKTGKKLVLSRETVRTLDPGRLGAADGATSMSVNCATRWQTCYTCPVEVPTNDSHVDPDPWPIIVTTIIASIVVCTS